MVYRSVLQIGIALTLAVSAAAPTEFPFAAGTDSTGWAQAESNAAGRVMIESPEFPRGLWVKLVDEAGNGLAGLQVEYQGRRDSLVALRCVDPSGMRQETLLWSRPGGDLLQLRLHPSESVLLPEGLVSIDLRLNPKAEALLKHEEALRLTGWEALALYLQERWQGRSGRVGVQIDGSAVFAVDPAHPEPEALLIDFLQERTKKSLGEIRASAVQGAILNAQAFTSDVAFLEEVVLLSTSFILVEGSELEKVVLSALRRSEGPVTLAEADVLLRLQVYDMVDVSPLAALTNLEELWLSDNQIVDVSPLAALTNLEEVDLSANQIVDVSPLAALTNMEELDLNDNQVIDVGPLAALTNLYYLGLARNRIADVSPLSVMTNLYGLYLHHNQIVDVSPLAALPNLTRLFLWDNQVVDVSPLSTLTNLRSLRMHSNRIVDVSPLATLTNLVVLDLGYNPTVDVSALAALTNLNELYLHHNQIVDASPFFGLTNLYYLGLARNRIADVSPLSRLTNLEVLWLEENQIVDVSPLAALTNLNRLTLGWNKIADAGPLSRLTNLEVLWLEENQIADAGPFAALTNLKDLRLTGNQIADIGPLVANMGLGEGDILELYSNRLTNEALNEQIPALRARGVQVLY